MERFKDSTGRWLTQGIFREYTSEAPYWLSRCNQEDAPCLHCAFVRCQDPTGYTFAEEYLGGWDHYKKLTQVGWFRSELAKWLHEVETKLTAEGIQAMRVQAKNGSPSAAKWLAEKGWDQRGPGRPTKEEKARALKIEGHLQQEVEEFHKRLFN